MAKIIFLLGTARVGRKSERIAQFVLATAQERQDIEPIFVDIRDFPQTHTEGLDPELTKKWNDMVQAADGLVIISPEYNHGYPGELKMFLDNGYKTYEGKPVGICGVSDGPIGGARMAEQLKLVLSAFQMMIINAAVYFAKVDEIFDEAGQMKDVEFWKKKVNGMFDQIMRYVK